MRGNSFSLSIRAYYTRMIFSPSLKLNGEYYRYSHKATKHGGVEKFHIEKKKVSCKTVCTVRISMRHNYSAYKSKIVMGNYYIYR